jgi:FtsH-binding integral membrane protein
MAADLVIPPPTPRLMDYPASIGLVVAVLATTLMLVVINKFDPTGGALTISLLVVLAFIGLVIFCALFTVPTDEISSSVIGGLTASFGAVVAFWLGRNTKGPP